ncbi:efflux RND transporter periplasmic adaptor subunit [Herminiimonas glaciei]|uniref:Efflux RND transporter periplasmic adaptor subunit n=1 Tax=Herminiimonas glaciei TaxID=523788 RepID=A0ABW2IC31_9BURK
MISLLVTGVYTELSQVTNNATRGTTPQVTVKKHMCKLMAVLALILLCIAVAGCDDKTAISAAQAETHKDSAASVIRKGNVMEVPEGSPLRTRLLIGTVDVSEIERPLTAPGVIEAVAEKLVKVAPPVPGRIIRLQRTLGDAVKAGDPLFTLDSAEISSARSEYTKARNTQAQAQRDFARQKLLFDADITAKKDYEAAQLSMDSADSDAHTAADRLAQLGVAKQSHTRSEYVLRSPISGRVIEMAGSQGGYWNDINAPIMTVADLSTVWLTANVAERDLRQVFIGQKAHITLNAYPDQQVEGIVRYVGELLDPETRSVKVRVAIANADGRFRPGMFAHVAFDGQKQEALTIPLSAIQQNGLEVRVFIEQGAHHYTPRTVTVGAQLHDRVEVTSGLKAGDRIVIKDGVLLND